MLFLQNGGINKQITVYIGHRYPTVVISHAVWFYYRFSLSFREVEEFFAARRAIGRVGPTKSTVRFPFVCCHLVICDECRLYVLIMLYIQKVR